MSSIPQTSGIYKIVCAPTGKVYVGSAAKLRNRHHYHFSALRLGRHDNSYLQHAWDKYGEQAFEFVIIELVLLSFLLEREQYWIDRLRACSRNKGFNIAPNAGSTFGRKHSEETRRKQSESHKGLIRTEEHRRNLSIAMKGRIFSEQTKQRMRKFQGSRPPHTDETRQKISDALRGRPRNDANTRAILSAHSKQWVLTSPDGIEYAVTGLAPFCRKYGLDRSSLREVANGRLQQYRGWLCRYADDVRGAQDGDGGH